MHLRRIFSTLILLITLLPLGARATCDDLLFSKSKLSVEALSTYDPKVWDEFIDIVRRRGETAAFLFGPLSHVLARMPADFATHVFTRLFARFDDLSKSGEASGLTDGWNHDPAPRRAVVALAISHINPLATLATARREGHSCEESYRRYLERAQAVFQLDQPYDARDVLAALRHLQRWIAPIAADKKILKRVGSFYSGQKELIIYGSLPLGRANLATSDIDINVIGIQGHITNHWEELREGLRATEVRINEQFSTRGRSSRLIVSPLYFLDKVNLLLSPIVFRIQDSQIVMEVYSPEATLRHDVAPRLRCILSAQ